MMNFQLIKVKADTPYERGVQYGYQAKNKIIKGIEGYKNIFDETSDKSWEQIREYADAYIPLIEENMPEIILEAKGIAEGAGVSFRDIMVLNCRYEITKFPIMKECTTCAVLPEASAGEKTILVKNWDYRAGIMDNIVILHIEDENEMRILGVAEAGQLIREGFNSYGIGLFNNSLQSVYDNEETGIPVTFLRRKVLSCKSYEEAKNLLLTSERSVSNNMLLASKEGKAVDIEAYPKGSNIIEPVRGIITHANHFTLNPELNAIEGSPRGDRLYELLMADHGSITVDYIKKCMCDHENYPKAICRHPSDASIPLFRRSITVASLIVDFDESAIHICAGPPCQGEYIVYRI